MDEQEHRARADVEGALVAEWFFAPWVPGEVRYPSFRHYTEQELQDLSAGS
jgi:hypothetical protein